MSDKLTVKEISEYTNQKPHIIIYAADNLGIGIKGRNKERNFVEDDLSTFEKVFAMKKEGFNYAQIKKVLADKANWDNAEVIDIEKAEAPGSATALVAIVEGMQGARDILATIALELKRSNDLKERELDVIEASANSILEVEEVYSRPEKKSWLSRIMGR